MSNGDHLLEVLCRRTWTFDNCQNDDRFEPASPCFIAQRYLSHLPPWHLSAECVLLNIRSNNPGRPIYSPDPFTGTLEKEFGSFGARKHRRSFHSWCCGGGCCPHGQVMLGMTSS